tara:strand:+ start:788 stop:3343 length:2556 start_codon:yes stop_codon:yes gene_type:complete
MSECRVKQSNGKSYNFGPRLKEINIFLTNEDVLKGLYTFIGDPARLESANLQDAERLLRDCKVVCKSQRGSSFYRKGGMFSEEMILLRLGSSYYSSYENFSHIVLHEYAHGLVDCKDRLTGEEKVYYARFKRGQSGFHCTAFKKGLLYLDREFGLLTEDQFTEILKLLESKTWKRPYEFERKYTKQLSPTYPQYIQTRGLTAAQLETTVKQSVKQLLNKGLTRRIMREGSAPRQLGWDEACFRVNTTWKDSDVGFCPVIFVKDVCADDFFINRESEGWEDPFFVHIFSGVTDYVKYEVIKKEVKSTYEYDSTKILKEVKGTPISREEQSAALAELLTSAQTLYDYLSNLGILGRGLNVALVTDHYEYESMGVRVALVFDPSLMSTIFKRCSDGNIDHVAQSVLLYNVLTMSDLDYRTLSPSDYSLIDSVVGTFIGSIPIPLEVDGWVPFMSDDTPPYGTKFAIPDVLGPKYKPSKLFWRGYLSSRIIAGNPIDLPGFFTQFNENDQNYGCGAEGELDPIKFLDGGFDVYRRIVGEDHPRYGLIDSGVGVYAESMDIEVSSAVGDFVSDLAEQIGEGDTFDCVAVNFKRGLYAEVLCAIKAFSLWVRSREQMRKFAEGTIDSVSPDLFATFDIPYSQSEVVDFAEDVFDIEEIIGLDTLEFSVSSGLLEKLISSRCPTIRLFKSRSENEICVLVSDGQHIGTLKMGISDFVAVDVLMEMLTADPKSLQDASEYGYLDLGPKPRENFKRSSPLSAGYSVAEGEDLLDLPIMTFTGSGNINLLQISPDRFSDTFEIFQNLTEIPNISLRTFLSATQDSVLVAVHDGEKGVRYYYKHLGDGFEVNSILAWWLLYL